VMLTVVLRRYSTGRALSEREAARVAMHPAETSYVDRTVAAHAPAMGKEWRVSMSIGDLRRAWHAKDYFAFLGLPSTVFLLCAATTLLLLGVSVAAKTWLIIGAASVVLVPIMAAGIFMLWAAVYTKLE
jgi:hypothetical protein